MIIENVETLSLELLNVRKKPMRLKLKYIFFYVIVEESTGYVSKLRYELNS
jgi:hypothetical protein